MEEEVEYLSLYDYLGKAAGGKLGKAVAAVAVEKGVSPKHRVVE